MGVKSSNLKLVSLDEIYKKCGFSNENNFCKRHTWKMENMYYSLYSKNSGNAGNENKFDLPPPIDEELYFGNMVLLKHSDEEITLENIKDCNNEEFEKLYNHLFGGFEDIEDSEEEEEEEVDPKNLTKHGYDKSDGFVVDDDDIEFEDIESVDSNDIILSEDYESCESDEDKSDEDESDEDESDEDESEESEDDNGENSLKEDKFISDEDDDEDDDEEDDEEDDDEEDDSD